MSSWLRIVFAYSLFCCIICIEGQWSSWYGSNAGNASRDLTQSGYVKQICVREGSHINAIKISAYSTGLSTDWFGSLNGTESCYEAASDSCFTSIRIRYDNRVNMLQFRTPEGESNGCSAGCSQQFGTLSGEGPISIHGSEANECLSGIETEYDATSITKIRFYFESFSEFSTSPSAGIGIEYYALCICT